MGSILLQLILNGFLSYFYWLILHIIMALIKEVFRVFLKQHDTHIKSNNLANLWPPIKHCLIQFYRTI